MVTPPNHHKLNFMITPLTHKCHGRISSGTMPVFPKILPVLALIMITLMCIAIPISATDTQNSTANTTTLSIPVGNLTVNGTIGNSTTVVSITYEPTTIQTGASVDSADNQTIGEEVDVSEKLIDPQKEAFLDDSDNVDSIATKVIQTVTIDSGTIQNGWNTQTIIKNVQIKTPDTGTQSGLREISLKMDTHDRPHISYYDTEKKKVMYAHPMANDNWTNEFVAKSAGTYTPSLALDAAIVAIPQTPEFKESAESLTPDSCPAIGENVTATDGMTYTFASRDPGIARGSLCRGACGTNCDNCKTDEVKVTVPGGTCTYNILSCPCHQGCIEHDKCYDKCADEGEGSRCNRKCDAAAYRYAMDLYGKLKGQKIVGEWLWSNNLSEDGYWKYYADPGEFVADGK